MKRQSTRRRETNTAERCKAYRQQAVPRCEVWPYLFSDNDAFKHLYSKPTTVTFQFDIHHIAGRPMPKERDYFSNLLHLSDKSHAWVEKHPREGELACWAAKYDLYTEQVIMAAAHHRELPEDVSQLHWHVPSLDRICDPFDGIRGRLHYLLGQDVGAVFRGYGERLLKVLEAGDGGQVRCQN